VAVKIFNEACLAKGYCDGDHVLILKVIRQEESYAIQPYWYPKDSGYIDFWWQSIRGNYYL
jgi:hypothetical protein